MSVVIPVHDGAAHLGSAIESVLAQTHPVRECLVVDDGSTDATRAVASRFGSAIHYVAQRHAGVSTARNRGIERAGGELVAFLDHDDTWHPDKLRRQVATLARAPEAVMCLCGVEVVDAAGGPTGELRLRPRSDLLTGMFMFDGTETVSCSSTGLARRSWLRENGGFEPTLGMSADWDLLRRALLTGGVAYVDDLLVRYRVHDANMSRSIRRMEADMERAFRLAFSDPRLPAVLRARRRRAYAGLYRMLAGSYYRRGALAPAVRAGLRAAAYDPTVFGRLRRPGAARPGSASYSAR